MVSSLKETKLEGWPLNKGKKKALSECTEALTIFLSHVGAQRFPLFKKTLKIK